MSTFATTQVVVTSAAAKVIAAIPNGQQVLIANRDATNSFFVGPAGVTTSTGAEVKPNSNYSQGWIDVPPEVEIWIVSPPAQTPRADISQVIAN